MSKLYRVVDNEDLEDYGVQVGDICTHYEDDSVGTAWFHNDEWLDDGIWCLMLTRVEEIVKEN